MSPSGDYAPGVNEHGKSVSDTIDYTWTVTASGVKLNSIYLPPREIANGSIPVDRYEVLVRGDESPLADGALQASTGQLSGMSALYRRYDLRESDELLGRIFPSQRRVILDPPNRGAIQTEGALQAPPLPAAEGTESSVFGRKSLNAIHLEVFRPENLLEWKPRTETDVYLAFGVLQECTPYKYCCGASQEILNSLGYKSQSGKKPDAILVDRATNKYLIAEFKIVSSAFSKDTLGSDEVDVLVVWRDDAGTAEPAETGPRICQLEDIACEQALQRLAQRRDGE